MAGQYYDAETGLHYNYHRYYDPSIGRYLRPDPIGLKDGINLYAYVQNDPINAIDPFGLEAMVLPGALPLPIIPPQIPAQQNSQKELANLLHSAWMDYVHPPIIAAGDLLYGGGIGDWIYDVTHPSADEVCFTMGRGKGDKYGPLWDAPGNPGWNNPQDNQPHDPEWWKKPDNWDKMSKWKKFKWWFKRAGAALTGSGGVGI